METRTKNLTLRDVHVGDWVQVWSPVTNRYMPPTKIFALFEDGTVYHAISDDQGDFFEDNIENVDALPITAELLEGFGFEIERSTDNPFCKTVKVLLNGICFGGILMDCKPNIILFVGYFECVATYMHHLTNYITVRHKDIKLEWKGVDTSKTDN